MWSSAFDVYEIRRNQNCRMSKEGKDSLLEPSESLSAFSAASWTNGNRQLIPTHLRAPKGEQCSMVELTSFNDTSRSTTAWFRRPEFDLGRKFDVLHGSHRTLAQINTINKVAGEHSL